MRCRPLRRRRLALNSESLPADALWPDGDPDAGELPAPDEALQETYGGPLGSRSSRPPPGLPAITTRGLPAATSPGLAWVNRLVAARRHNSGKPPPRWRVLRA